MSKKVVVIGAGAAGLIAAGKAAECGKEVILLEKNDRIGKKILISGKGRCNITNNTDIEGLIQNIPGNGNFLYSAFFIVLKFVFYGSPGTRTQNYSVKSRVLYH